MVSRVVTTVLAIVLLLFALLYAVQDEYDRAALYTVVGLWLAGPYGGRR